MKIGRLRGCSCFTALCGRFASALGAVLFLLSALYAMPAGAQEVKKSGFTRPGILVTREQLIYVRAKIRADQEPWKSAFERTLSDRLATRAPHPWQTVECGAYSNPNHGCNDETDDAKAAYTQALLWVYTRDERYAESTRRILNAWADTLRGGHTNFNAPLQASWAAEQFTRAAEILEYTYDGWPQSEKSAVRRMFTEQYLPDVEKMFTEAGYQCYANNWHASGIEAMMNIAIFTNNRNLFNRAVQKWRELVPAYIYEETDGPLPRDIPGCHRTPEQMIRRWHGQTTFVNGLVQETCRDLGHTDYGLAAIINAAETARLQGVDLYDEQRRRITDAMEFNTKFRNGEPIPQWLCGGTLNLLDAKGTFEIGYNQYAVREGMSLPETNKFLERTRPTVGYFHYLWETLTHGLTGRAQ
ncbi:alginate lyase family protein [Dyella sp.]|uniref:alginate lyase family protein n=1 Tax=Dyella sp. TaxID=1869338 RepID=UPI002D78C5F8|nr:alginate lyase family protein [Dyella sp.]HET7329464.1 alginate lyase family protein [Dyella sp.]